jgi:DegV family protein with EDD domain
MIGICTDSNSQLPPQLAGRFSVEIVPITVIVDDREFLEGVDLEADGFYAYFTDTHQPTVTTTHPSPGQFALAYDDLAERGCTQILSIHAGSTTSGTINAARLAAHNSPVPVRLVDSGTASFGVSCCVWAAAEAIAAGASIDQAATLAESLAPRIGSVFIVGALDLVQTSGRARGSLEGDGIAVLTLRNGHIEVLERVMSVADAVNSMAHFVLGWGQRLNVAVGTADRDGAPISKALAQAVGESANVIEVVHFRIGPSVGAHTGPGSSGCFVFPAGPGYLR